MAHKLSDAHRKAISDANKGRKKSDEQRQKMADAQRLAWTPERREAFAKQRSGENNPNFGKPLSDEQREAARQRFLANNPMRNRVFTDEDRAALSEKFRGKAPALKKYGVTAEQYAEERASGNRWCFFGKHFVPSAEFGTTGCCNGCRPIFQRQSDLKKKYSLTHADYEQMLWEQGGVCAICGVAEQSARRKHMMIDHNHTTGAVRGILCGPCNTAVERLETIPNWGLLAAQYLAKVHVEP